MTPSRLRAWIREYGLFGVLMAAAILAVRHVWTRYRLPSLFVCSLTLLFGGCLLLRPQSPRSTTPVLPPLVKTTLPSSSPQAHANQDFIAALSQCDASAARAALAAGADLTMKVESEYSERRVSAFVYLLGHQMGRNSAEEAPEINKLLLDHGADPNEADEDGTPLLVLMADLGYTTTMRYLLEHGADIHAKDENQWTALHYAVVHNNVKAVALLLTWGADVHAQNDNGATPLMLHNPNNAELAKDESNRRFTTGDPDLSYPPLTEQTIRRLKRVGEADEKKIIKMLLKAGAKTTSHQ